MECTSCHRTGFTADELDLHTSTEYCQTPIANSTLRAHAKFDECEAGPLVVSDDDPRILALSTSNSELKAELARVAAIVEAMEKRALPSGGTPAAGSKLEGGHP